MTNTWKNIISLKEKYLPQGSFISNVLTLLTGTTIAQIISVLLSPLLARLYTPQDFGIVALYSSLVAIIGVIATGRYELTILLPSKRKNAFNLVVLSIIIAIFVSVLTFLLIFFLHSQIIFVLKNEGLSRWLYLIPISVLFTGVYQACNYWLTRVKQFKDLAVNKVLQSVTNTGVNLGFGLINYGPGMVLGGLIGQIVGSLRLGLHLFKEWKSQKKNISLKRIKALALFYKEFPKKSSIGAFFNSLSYQIEYFLLSALFGLIGVGNYYFANRIASIPNSFLSSAIWQVFLGENRDKDKVQIFQVINSYQQKVFTFITLPMFSVIFVIADLWKLVFGKNMIEAINYFYPLIISSHVNLIVASFSLFTILNRPDAEMNFNVLLAILKALAIVLSFFLFHNSFATVVAISLIQFMMFFCLGSWNYMQLDKPYFHFSLLYFKNIVRIFPYLMLLCLIKVISNNFLLILSGVVICNLYHWMRINKQHA